MTVVTVLAVLTALTVVQLASLVAASAHARRQAAEIEQLSSHMFDTFAADPVWHFALLSPHHPSDRRTRLHGTARWVRSPPSIDLGRRGWATIPSHTFIRAQAFTAGLWVRPTALLPRKQFLYANWKHPWSFYIALVPARVARNKAYAVRAVLRRNGHAALSSRLGYLASVQGGLVVAAVWTHVAITWQGSSGTLSVPVNGQRKASAVRFPHAHRETRAAVNPSGSDEIGFNRDANFDFFYGSVSELLTTDFALW